VRERARERARDREKGVDKEEFTVEAEHCRPPTFFPRNLLLVSSSSFENEEESAFLFFFSLSLALSRSRARARKHEVRTPSTVAPEAQWTRRW